MNDATVAGLLEGSEIFRLLDRQGQNRLAAVAQPIQLPAEYVVMQEGEEGDAFYFCASGQLRVRARNIADNQTHVATLGPNSVFGEIGVLTREPRTATVTTDTACELLKFEMLAVFDVLKDYPDVLAELKRLGLARSEDLLVKVIT